MARTCSPSLEFTASTLSQRCETPVLQLHNPNRRACSRPKGTVSESPGEEARSVDEGGRSLGSQARAHENQQLKDATGGWAGGHVCMYVLRGLATLSSLNLRIDMSTADPMFELTSQIPSILPTWELG